MRKLSTLALFLALQLGQLSPAVGFELDEILGAPYASQLISATSAERIAWVSYERGVRNIWTARSPDFEARAVTKVMGSE